MHVAAKVTQPNGTDRNLFHQSRLAIDAHDVADRELILRQDKDASNDVLDQRLRARSDGEADDAGTGQRRADIHAYFRQHDKADNR